MTGVLGKPALARQDIVIGVARTQRLGATWRRSENPDGSNPQPVDLTGWEGRFRLTSNDGQVWLDKAMSTDTAAPEPTGQVVVELEESDTTAPIWSGRHVGKWAFIMTNGDERVVLAAGNARIVQEGTL